MCGIAGTVARNGKVDRAQLETACDALEHRGPDDSGIWVSEDGKLGLGHRRLSIVDLSPSGHQPMIGAGGDHIVVFNGEIYNHRTIRRQLEELGYSFRSTSDTEVLLAAYRHWGENCLEHLVGMFAVALFDQTKRTLFLARDRAGEKPLFYHRDDTGLRFASELKALMVDPSLPRRIDSEALDCYLAMGFVPSGRCILKGFSKLPPGHAMRYNIDDGRCTIWRYWGLPEYQPVQGGVDEDALAEELQELLETAVSEQISADVPVGVLLSGGLDSSLVSAFASRAHAGIKTYCVRFPGSAEHDETEHARLVARHLGTEHVEIEAGSITAGLLPSLAHQFDEPMADSSMIPVYLVSRAIRQHCKVALGGDGGDELFGGYNNYNKALRVDSIRRKLPLGLSALIGSAADRCLPVGYRKRTWLQHLKHNPSDGFPLVSPHFEPSERTKLISAMGVPAIDAETVRRGLIPNSGDIVQDATRADFSTFLPDDILVKVDRASMLNSLEVRAPFLDHRIIEFAFRKVPSALKASPASRKIFLKQFGRNVLPPQFDMVRKQGFTIPLGKWLESGQYRELFEDVLYSRDCIFDRDSVARLFQGIDRSRANGERLFALVLFELWRRDYDVSI